jgi:hypothetical protein
MFQDLTGNEPLFGLWNFDNVENDIARDHWRQPRREVVGKAKIVAEQLPTPTETPPLENVLQPTAHQPVELPSPPSATSRS